MKLHSWEVPDFFLEIDFLNYTLSIEIGEMSCFMLMNLMTQKNKQTNSWYFLWGFPLKISYEPTSTPFIFPFYMEVPAPLGISLFNYQWKMSDL